MAPNNPQSRKWQLTINNYQTNGLSVEVILSILNSLTLDYYCLCEEIATTGTPHVHIFLYSKSPIRFSTIRDRFYSLAHIEKAFGSAVENRDYILKEGKWKDTSKAETTVPGSFIEFGELPSEGRENSPLMAQLIDDINAGYSTAQIITEHPKLAFRVRDIDSLREVLLSEKYTKENRTQLTVTYIYGKTGTGKTSGIFKEHAFTDICRITSYTTNGVKFDAYHGQDVLCFEEFRHQISMADMLSFLDIYPVMLPARYVDRVACYTKVYILSNLPLDKQYTSVQKDDPATWNAFVRRITKVYHQIAIGERQEINKEIYLHG